MGVLQNHAIGRDRRVMIATEAVAGALEKPTANDAVRVLSSTVKSDGAFDPRTDSGQGRSVDGVIEKKHTLEWSLSSLLYYSQAKIPNLARHTPRRQF